MQASSDPFEHVEPQQGISIVVEGRKSRDRVTLRQSESLFQDGFVDFTRSEPFRSCGHRS